MWGEGYGVWGVGCGCVGVCHCVGCGVQGAGCRVWGVGCASLTDLGAHLVMSTYRGGTVEGWAPEGG
jgi:hypothetical protein